MDDLEQEPEAEDVPAADETLSLFTRPSIVGPPLFHAWSKKEVAMKPAGTSSPFPLQGHSMAATAASNGEFLIFGGYSQPAEKEWKILGIRNTVYLLSRPNASLRLMPTTGDVPSPRAYHASAMVGETLVVWGGRGAINEEIADAGLYLLDTGKPIFTPLSLITDRLGSILEVDLYKFAWLKTATALWTHNVGTGI